MTVFWITAYLVSLFLLAFIVAMGSRQAIRKGIREIYEYFVGATYVIKFAASTEPPSQDFAPTLPARKTKT